MYSQKYKDRRDWNLKDSIQVNNEDYSSERELNIRNTLKVSNEYAGTNNLTNNWNDYRNLTMLEYGVFINKLPIYLTVGNERGSQYNQTFNRFIGNVKIDFVQYLQSLKQDLNLNQSIDKLNYENADEILQEELNKNIKKELNNRFSMEKIDSLHRELESMRNFEQKLNNPLEIEKIKQRKTLLKEFALGNKIDGLNYDSIQKLQLKFDQDQMRYDAGLKNKDIKDYRKKYDEVLNNKDKAIELKNQTEGRIKRLQDRFKLGDLFNLSRLKVSKFNLGQSSLDNSELVFRGFMIQGLNLEVKSPFYFNFVYSLPFQTNIFSNYKLNSIQNNQVQTTGVALGNSPDARFNAQVGYYRFKESSGAYRFGAFDSPKMGIQNSVFLFTSVLKFSPDFKTKVELAKSETNSKEFISFSNLANSAALKVSNEFSFFQRNTTIKLELQSVGLGYYSSANPFVQRGKGGLISWDQKLGSKLNFKAKTSYRYNEDSNRLNSNLSTYGLLKYKLNRNTSFELRANYFKANLNFKIYTSTMSNELYSFTWLQKLKKKKSVHSLMSSLQYSRTIAKSSEELNNTGNQRNAILNTMYDYSNSKLNLNANLEDNYSLDSSRHGISNGLMLGYVLSGKTQIGGGFNSMLSNTEFRQLGFNLNAMTTILNKLSISASITLNFEYLYKQTTLSPQIRAVYTVF